MSVVSNQKCVVLNFKANFQLAQYSCMLISKNFERQFISMRSMIFPMRSHPIRIHIYISFKDSGLGGLTLPDRIVSIIIPYTYSCLPLFSDWTTPKKRHIHSILTLYNFLLFIHFFIRFFSYIQRVSSDGYRLTLITASLVHTARYTCISTNEAGAAEKDFDLDVLGKPQPFLCPNKYRKNLI